MRRFWRNSSTDQGAPSGKQIGFVKTREACFHIEDASEMVAAIASCTTNDFSEENKTKTGFLVRCCSANKNSPDAKLYGFAAKPYGDWVPLDLGATWVTFFHCVFKFALCVAISTAGGIYSDVFLARRRLDTHAKFQTLQKSFCGQWARSVAAQLTPNGATPVAISATNERSVVCLKHSDVCPVQQSISE